MKSSLLTLAVAFFILASAEAQQLKYLSLEKGKIPDTEAFSNYLKQSYQDSAVGWAFTIWKDGKLLHDQSGGFKITPADRKNKEGIPFSSSTRLHVASLSKTITVVAIAKLIDQKKLTWDARVKSFLPSYWKLHPDFENLTIRELVAMKSGLDNPLNALSSHTDSLRKIMERGPNPKKVGTFNYQNTGYGILRIIIGYANGYKELQPAADSMVVGIVTANMYKEFINTNLFLPAKISPADCSITDQEPALLYPFPYSNEPGELTGTGGQSNNGDLNDYAGGFGWYLSAVDAGKFINAVFVDQKILSKKTLTELFAIEFPFRIRKNKYSEHFGTGGDWGSPTSTGWKGIHTYFYCFPDNIVVTVFVNSGEGSPTRRVIRAYERSFK